MFISLKNVSFVFDATCVVVYPSNGRELGSNIYQYITDYHMLKSNKLLRNRFLFLSELQKRSSTLQILLWCMQSNSCKTRSPVPGRLRLKSQMPASTWLLFTSLPPIWLSQYLGEPVASFNGSSCDIVTTITTVTAVAPQSVSYHHSRSNFENPPSLVPFLWTTGAFQKTLFRLLVAGKNTNANIT